MRTKLVLSALVAVSLLGATAMTSAQAQNQPAPGASSSGNVGPGAADGAMRQGTGGAMQNNTGGAMQNNNMGGTTGSSAGPDASQQGAPTAAAPNARGDATEPGNVQKGVTR